MRKGLVLKDQRDMRLRREDAVTIKIPFAMKWSKQIMQKRKFIYSMFHRSPHRYTYIYMYIYMYLYIYMCVCVAIWNSTPSTH